MAVVIASDLRQGHGRRAPAARRLVQARAPRPHDDRRAQRRRQDDAAADARGGDVDRRRRARARQGHARRAARPAPAARARPQPARLRPVRLRASSSSSRPSCARSSRRWPTATTKAIDRYADVYAPLRGRRRLRLARPRARYVHGLGFARRRPRPPAARRSPAASSRAPRWPGRSPPSPTCCCSTSRRTTSTSSRWSGSSRRWSASTRRSCSSPTTAGSWRRWAPACSSSRPAARASSRAPGTRGARSRPRASSRSARRSSSSRPRSSAWSASSSASATRRPRRRQAQSRVKKLDKIERIERDPRDGRALGFEFKKPERSGRVIFELEDGRLRGRATRRESCSTDAELWLERGEHVSLVGPNGTGKTTLIEALAGERELDGGRLRSGHNVKIGYLSQHDEELEGGSARTVLEACVKRTGLHARTQARALLGRFLFSGEEADKPLDGLSGGERKRLALAILVQSGANVLILDEPTNHLDLESREALEDALRGVPGLAAARHPRPRAARRGRHAHGRDRGLRRCAPTSAAGPSTRACARSARPRARTRRARRRTRRAAATPARLTPPG